MRLRDVVARAARSVYALSTGAAPTTELGYGAPDSFFWGGIEEETPELRWPLDLEVYDRMRRTDTQVRSVLRAVTSPVMGTGWRVTPNGARDEVVEHIAKDLGLPIDGQDPNERPRTKGRFSWTDHLRMSMLDLPFGHMAFEQVYRLDERGRVRLRKLAPRMPRTINSWDIARDGGLRAIMQEPPAGEYAAKPVRIPVNRLVVYTHEREAGNWRGQSMLRPAYKFWALKDRLLRVQAQVVERNGLGIPVYTGAPRESDLAPGQKIATSWRAGEAAGAALRHGADITLKGVEGRLPDADPVIRYYDEQIAKSALLHFLTLGTQTGSWALGTTFADFFVMSEQTVAQSRADVVNEHVVEDLVDLNWGEDEPTPRVVFDEIGSKQAATADGIKALIDCGAVLPDRELEEHLRQKFNLPPKGAYSVPAGPAPDPNPVPGGTAA